MLRPINKIHASVLKILQIVKQVLGCGIMLWAAVHWFMCQL